jgi:acetoin utilization deacetylase AcuC-like enzyme
VLDGRGWAYALGRPTGHHAGPRTADGFCLFNQEALAAERARERGVERVAVLDWDVHHGNGTQACFYDRADVLTLSVHMRHGSWDPETHPETGACGELGAGPGLGFNVNVELELGAGDAAYLAAVEEIAAPVLERFAPGLLVVASGQDASGVDPLGRHNVSMAGFRALGERTAELVDGCCDGRLLLVQEGGYQPAYGPLCLHATLEGLLGTGALLEDPVAYVPDDPARGAADVRAARAALALAGGVR